MPQRERCNINRAESIVIFYLDPFWPEQALARMDCTSICKRLDGLFEMFDFFFGREKPQCVKTITASEPTATFVLSVRPAAALGLHGAFKSPLLLHQWLIGVHCSSHCTTSSNGTSNLGPELFLCDKNAANIKLDVTEVICFLLPNNCE